MCVNFIELCAYSADGGTVKINERFGIRSSFPEVGEFELRIAPEVAAQFPELLGTLSRIVFPWGIYEIWKDVCESPETTARMVLFHILYINTILWLEGDVDLLDEDEISYTIETMSSMYAEGAIAQMLVADCVENTDDYSGLVVELRQLLGRIDNRICTPIDGEGEPAWSQTILTVELRRKNYLGLENPPVSLKPAGVLLSFLVELEAGEFGLPDDPECEEETGD